MNVSAPVLRDEFISARVRVIVDACEHIGEVGLGIDFGLTAVLAQCKHNGRSGSGIRVSDKQLIFGAEVEWDQGVFSLVVVDTRRDIFEALAQRSFMI